MKTKGQNCPSNHDVGPFADPDDCASLWNCEGGCAIKSQVLMSFVNTSIFGSTSKNYFSQYSVWLPTKDNFLVPARDALGQIGQGLAMRGEQPR